MTNKNNDSIMEMDRYTKLKNNIYKVIEYLTTKEELACIRLKNWGK